MGPIAPAAATVPTLEEAAPPPRPWPGWRLSVMAALKSEALGRPFATGWRLCLLVDSCRSALANPPGRRARDVNPAATYSQGDAHRRVWTR